MRRRGWGEGMATRKAKKATASGRPPRIEHLIVRHRIEVVESLLARMQSIEPVTAADLDAERVAVKSLPEDDARRQAFERRLAARREVAGELGALARANMPVLRALEDQCLPDRGFVGELMPSAAHTWPPPPKPLQAHMRPGPMSSWESSVLRCAAECPVAGTECIEPAMLACVRILHELRRLVEDDGARSEDERIVYDHRGVLRTTAREFLRALDSPKVSLDAIARAVKRDGAHVRRFSAPMQRLGLIRMRDDKSWERTEGGTLVLRRT